MGIYCLHSGWFHSLWLRLACTAVQNQRAYFGFCQAIYIWRDLPGIIRSISLKNFTIFGNYCTIAIKFFKNLLLKKMLFFLKYPLCVYFYTKCKWIFAQHCSPPQSSLFNSIFLLVKVFSWASAFYWVFCPSRCCR